MRRTVWLGLGLGGAVLALAGCGVGLRGSALPSPDPGGAMPPGTFREVLRTGEDGRRRTFEVHVPASYDPTRPTPLVVVLHGAFNTGRGIEAKTRFSALSEREGFLVAYPDGIGFAGLFQHWNAGWCCGKALRIGLDDVGFVDRVVDRIEEVFAVDPTRVYMIGESNGGMLTYLYAAEHPERLAAAGVSSGAYGGRRAIDEETWHVPRPAVPVPLVAFHGLADDTLPFAGGADVGSLPVLEGLEFWAEANGCAAAPVTEELADGAIVHRRWTAEDHDQGCAPVELWTIAGWGHEWAGGKPGDDRKAAALLHGFDATRTAWDFFRRFRREPAQGGS
ncbi:MAG: alpha/beta fold hydrolase [Acidobacteria bacterium]|nr:alpha/beta fold hydrolase [Acidobacteriota bacterium]